jgi:hypothetical protein
LLLNVLSFKNCVTFFRTAQNPSNVSRPLAHGGNHKPQNGWRKWSTPERNRMADLEDVYNRVWNKLRSGGNSLIELLSFIMTKPATFPQHEYSSLCTVVSAASSLVVKKK